MSDARPWIAALFLALAPLPTEAQEAEASRDAVGGGWTLALGMARQGVSDELASPLRHRGTGLLLGAGYGSRSERGLWELRLSYAGPRVGSKLESARGGFEDIHQADLAFAWLRKATTLLDGRVDVYAGGALDVRGSYRVHHYDVHEFGSRTEDFGDLFAPLQASAMWELALGGHGWLGHRLSVPVVSLVMRSPWTGLKYAPDVAVAGPTEVTGFDSELRWRMALGGRWSLGVFHRLTLLRYPEPRPLDWVVHRLGFELGVGP